MMTQAFYTGISGIKSASFGIDVVSNNLANVSTTGFRGYTSEFASLFESAINTTAVDSNTVGVGTRAHASSMIKLQGPIILSDRSTDIAIMGNGWFGIQGDETPAYTRDGAFNFDANDDLVTNEGLHVLGTMAKNISADNVLTKKLDEVKLGTAAAQEKLQFPKTLTYPPEPTTNAKFLANLGAGHEGFEVITVGASVVDAQNNKNHLRLEFSKSAVQNPPGTQWDIIATTQSLDGETIYDTQRGNIAFSPEGAQISSTIPDIDNNGSPIKIDLGTEYNGIVSIDIPVVSGSSTSNGTVGGDLVGYSISQNAEVIATFTNGMQSSVGKIAVYHFSNEQGLERISGTKFKETSNSGRPSFYVNEKGESINGTSVANFRLESSNVELSVGLTDLIILQRTFDANSKSITTADQMMQKALQMDAK